MTDFALKFIELVIWPAVAVLGILILREPLKELVPTLKKLKYKELELEFEKETYKLLEEIEEVVSKDNITVPSPTELKEGTEVEEKEREVPRVMFSLERMSPEDIVKHSWLELEKTFKSAMHKKGFSISPFSVTKVAQALASQNLIDNSHLRAVYKLQAMRNRLVHNSEILSDQSAENFSASVMAVQSVLEGLND